MPSLEVHRGAHNHDHSEEKSNQTTKDNHTHAAAGIQREAAQAPNLPLFVFSAYRGESQKHLGLHLYPVAHMRTAVLRNRSRPGRRLPPLRELRSTVGRFDHPLTELTFIWTVNVIGQMDEKEPGPYFLEGTVSHSHIYFSSASFPPPPVGTPRCSSI